MIATDDQVSIQLSEPEQSISTTPKWPESKEVVEAHGQNHRSKWDMTFAASSAFAVFIDPLICYAPVLINDSVCCYWDQTSHAEPFATSWTRIIGGPHTKICKILNGKKTLRFLRILPRICAALPILQAVILTGKYTSVEKTNFFYLIPIQYTVRAIRLYRRLNRSSNIETSVRRLLKAILDFLPFILAAHVPLLENTDEKALKAICNHLKPVTYGQDVYIIREGEPLRKMLFITRGTALTYKTFKGGTNVCKCLEKSDFYGEELLNWAFKSGTFSELPISPTTVVSQTKVQAFSLRANHLKSVVDQFWWRFQRELPHSQLEHFAASSLQAFWCRRRAKAKGPTGWHKRTLNYLKVQYPKKGV
ncbi:unnamed protein product [Prunus armeniaca]